MKRFQQIDALRIVANGVAGLALFLALLAIGCGNPSGSNPSARHSETTATPRTGLVIVKNDVDPPTTRCIELTDFPPPNEASGIDVLTLSNLDLAYQAASGNGVLVCRIDTAGCDYPGESCLCQCDGETPCHYWTYWQRPPSGEPWVRSDRGGAGTIAQAGGIEGWVFGSGDTPPPPISFEEACP